MEAGVTDRGRHPNVHPCAAICPAVVADAAGNRILLINALDFDAAFDAESDVILDTARSAHDIADIFGVVTEGRQGLHITFWNPDTTPEAVCANGIRCVPFLFPDRSQDRIKISTRCMQAEAQADGEWSEVRLQLGAISIRQIERQQFPGRCRHAASRVS